MSPSLLIPPSPSTPLPPEVVAAFCVLAMVALFILGFMRWVKDNDAAHPDD